MAAFPVVIMYQVALADSAAHLFLRFSPQLALVSFFKLTWQAECSQSIFHKVAKLFVAHNEDICFICGLNPRNGV